MAFLKSLRGSFIGFTTIVALVVCCAGCAPHQNPEEILQFDMEPSHSIDCLVGDVFYSGDSQIDFGTVVKQLDTNAVFCDLFAESAGKYWFVYEKEAGNGDTASKEAGKEWIIATYDRTDGSVEEKYKSVFCENPGLDECYFRTNGDVPYIERSGFYDDGKIVLSDHSRVVEYTIGTREVREYRYEFYPFPTPVFAARPAADQRSVLIRTEDSEKEMSLDDFAGKNDAFKRLLSIVAEKEESIESFQPYDQIYGTDKAVVVVSSVLVRNSKMRWYFCFLYDCNNDEFYYIGRSNALQSMDNRWFFKVLENKDEVES